MTFKIYQIIQNYFPRHSLNKWLTYFEDNNNFEKKCSKKIKNIWDIPIIHESDSQDSRDLWGQIDT